MTPINAQYRKSDATLIPIALTALACLAAMLLLNWPGIVQTDATVQWYEARTASITSQHPPMMALIWRGLDRLLPGPQLMLVLQCALFWAAALVLSLRARMSAVVAALFFVGALLYPLTLARSPDIMKDMLGGNLALVAWCLLLKHDASSWRNRLIAAAFTLFGLACLVRYQLAVAALPALTLVGMPARPGKLALLRMTLALFCLGITIISAQLAMHAVLTIDPAASRRSVFTVQLFDIAGIVAREPDTVLDVFARRGADTDALKRQMRELYTSDRSDDLQWWPDGANVPRLQGTPGMDTPIQVIARGLTYDDMSDQWRTLVLKYPWSLLSHRLASFGRLMGTGNVYACWPAPTVGFQKKPFELWDDLGAEDLGLQEPVVMQVLHAKWFPSGTVLFRPWAYLLLSTILAAAMVRESPRRNAAPLSMLAACWLYWGSFLLANAACDVRYSYFPMSAVLFVAAWAGAHFMVKWWAKRPSLLGC